MKTFLKSNSQQYLLLSLILIMAAFFRFYGLNWDQNHHLHPDERFLTMVVLALEWPQTLSEYFNPLLSPLNPYNTDYNFFVYGTFPLKIVKFASQFLEIDKFAYNNVTLVGRAISALFDLGVVALVYLIGKRVFDKTVGIFSSFLYAVSVLPIQLAHFFAVDTFLVFFIVGSFYFLLNILEGRSKILSSGLLGVSFGLALASKISAVLFLPIVILGFFYLFLKERNIKTIAALSLFLIIVGYLVYRIADPRAFADISFLNPTLNSQFIDNIVQLKSFSNPGSSFPPAVQWINTKPIIFPLRNMLIWGLGLPLGVLTLSGIIYSLWFYLSKVRNLIRRREKILGGITSRQFGYFLIVFWVVFLFLYQGIQFVKALRYFYLIYPFLSIIAATFLCNVIFKKIKANYLIFVFLITIIIYPLSFISIYSRPHSRVLASEWIFNNIPEGSTISCEHWDDCLPLSKKGKSPNLYQIETLTLYDQDNQKKWEKLNQQFEKIDYLILSSNRLWGSIPKVPEKYPDTSKFCQDLFSERLQFTKVAEITSYPTVPLVFISISDDSADESFTVYDHPKVLIFKNTANRE